MPTVYTHWHFGDECIETMPDNLKEVINENRDIYNIGVHGPDFMFYYLFNNDVRKYGSDLHKKPAKEFFMAAAETYRQNKDKEAMLAYLMGFLTHFTLDSVTHSYIERKKEVSTASHYKIESEYDKYMIEKDGRKENVVDRSENLRPNYAICKVMSRFYPYKPATVYLSCVMHRLLTSAMNCISDRKFFLLRDLLVKIGQPMMADLMMDKNDFPPCHDSNIRLDKLKDKALKLYPRLMLNYLNYINGDGKLSKYFDHVFDKWPDYKNIPVLSYEDELKYKV